MSLYVPEPPAGGMQIINAALGSLLNQPSSTLRAMADAGPDTLTAAAAHRVYFVGLESVAGGQLLAQAEPIRWRYIVLDDERPVVAAELDINEANGELEFSSTNEGALVEGTLEGVRIAESLYEVRDGDYELRLLEVPALYVIALWLHGEQKDLLIPLLPTHENLEPFSVYTEEELLTAVGQSAVKRTEIGDENV